MVGKKFLPSTSISEFVYKRAKLKTKSPARRCHWIHQKNNVLIQIHPAHLLLLVSCPHSKFIGRTQSKQPEIPWIEILHRTPAPAQYPHGAYNHSHCLAWKTEKLLQED